MSDDDSKNNFDFQMRKVPKDLEAMDLDDQIMMSAERYIKLIGLQAQIPKIRKEEYKRGWRKGIIVTIAFATVMNIIVLAIING